MTTKEFLTTAELADLLRIKERKVYDLVSTDAIPHIRATGKILFERRAIDIWLALNSGGPENLSEKRLASRILAGSHDPLLEWALRESGCGVAMLVEGSLKGIERFRRGEALATGMHLQAPENGSWNTHALDESDKRQAVVLVEWAKRERGIVFRRSARQVAQVADLKGLKVVQRQQGAGSQVLLKSLLEKEGLGLSDIDQSVSAGTESEALEAVASGRADAALALRSAVQSMDLSFHPVVVERFDILIDRKSWFEAPFRDLWAFCDGEGFKAGAARFTGYDLSARGTIHFNGA